MVVGGAILGPTSVLDINWVSLAGGLGFVALNAVLAGAQSYLSIIANGISPAYQAPSK